MYPRVYIYADVESGRSEMPASEQITIKRGVLNELIQSGTAALSALKNTPQGGRFERALKAAKSERARVNSARARESRKQRQEKERR